ncbi:MAG: nucleoside kinase [Anaerolineales bacterium]|nr:nucleoside kinase [Anaerolineales bacterium]MCB0012339.1 nucleoside kinase [Anaerolineales bacterium]MCB0017449.1 nucleoside kinase [Anaerolineales bacterium]MCB0030008.1 nucleoside kinase [Anaerolineales bacterium]MCB8960872.1 nucleoside kinase [Ardenticatenales bacterium]
MIKAAPPRKTVQVRLDDGRTFNGPVGETAEAFFLAARPAVKGDVVACLLNGHLRELTEPILHDSELIPITTGDSDGGRIYRRSLSFLLIAAYAELFPDGTLNVQHSLPFGGYYCESTAPDRLSAADLTAIQARMEALVEADLPITREQLPLDEAIALFRAQGDEDKAELFAKRRKGYLTIYELNGVRDYFHGFMVSRTSYLRYFALHAYKDGFIVQFPRRHRPDILLPFADSPRLADVFQTYSDWLEIIGVPRVAALNNALSNGRAKETVLVAEAFHQRQVTHIAGQIAARQPDAKLVLISGPTSAGKTTFSKRLAVQLLAHGIHPVTIALDNYFVDRDRTPRDANGDYDFEALHALDLPLFQSHLRDLLRGDAIQMPHYNFITGKRESGGELRLRPDQVLLLEGIHGLNPRLVGDLPGRSMYRIFISAFTQLNLDLHNRVPTTDTRLLRRIVRDAAHRGYSAADTIGRWPSVRRGEKTWIFPNQDHADIFFNSALVYELAALKTLAFPLLLQVEPGTPERIEANRLRAFLQWFDPVDINLIPDNSLLREFVGGSVLEDFQPWVD